MTWSSIPQYVAVIIAVGSILVTIYIFRKSDQQKKAAEVRVNLRNNRDLFNETYESLRDYSPYVSLAWYTGLALKEFSLDGTPEQVQEFLTSDSITLPAYVVAQGRSAEMNDFQASIRNLRLAKNRLSGRLNVIAYLTDLLLIGERRVAGAFFQASKSATEQVSSKNYQNINDLALDFANIEYPYVAFLSQFLDEQFLVHVKEALNIITSNLLELSDKNLVAMAFSTPIQRSSSLEQSLISDEKGDEEFAFISRKGQETVLDIRKSMSSQLTTWPVKDSGRGEIISKLQKVCEAADFLRSSGFNEYMRLGNAQIQENQERCAQTQDTQKRPATTKPQHSRKGSGSSNTGGPGKQQGTTSL